MNTQSFYYGDGHYYSHEEIMEQNHKRIERGIALGIGWFEVDDTEVRYYYSENDDRTYHVAALVGAAREGNDFDSFVLTADNGTEFVAYIYGIDALNTTEDALLKFFHVAVERYRAEEERLGTNQPWRVTRP